MAYTSTPGDLFPGMTSDGTELTIPIAALADYGLTSTLAHQATGDARALARALAARVDDWYRSLPAADRPLALTAETQLSVVFYGATNFPGCEKETIKITTYRERPDEAVAAEPV